MTEFLMRHFIKNADKINDNKVRESYGRLGGVVGIIVNAILSASKILLGVIFGSVAILADGVNNMSDAGSSVMTLISFKLASKPPDKEHPFGHARLEYISGLVISFFIIFLGIDLLRNSFDKIFNPSELRFSLISVGVLAFSILMKLWLSVFNKKMGDRIDSAAFRATAQDSRNDVFTTSAVLLCTLIFAFTGLNLDGLMGFAVAGFIIYSGVKLIIETSSPLLGEAPDKEFVTRIYKKILTYDKVLGVHDLVVHNYGPGRCFASVHAEMDYKNDVMESHDITDRIERDFYAEGIHIVVHLDPIVTDDKEVDAMKGFVAAALRGIDQRLSLHDFRMVRGVYHTNVIFDVVVPSDFRLSDEQLISDIKEAVKKIDENLFAVVEVDRCYLGL